MGKRSAPVVPGPGPAVLGSPLQAEVDGRGVEKAIRKLKRAAANEGVPHELKKRAFHMTKSQRRRRKDMLAERRRRKAARLLLRAARRRS